MSAVNFSAEKRLSFLLKYHHNLSIQLNSQPVMVNREFLMTQLQRVEVVMETILLGAPTTMDKKSDA